jgi:hypothetical protein
MQRLITRVRAALLVAMLAIVAGMMPQPSLAQVDAPLILIDRGQLWNAYYYAKMGAPFNNWARINYGMDWPGFRPEFVRADVGGPASYALTGGIWFSARDSHDKVIALDDFAMYASSTTPEPGAKYLVSRHERIYKDGANHWLASNPDEAEELIISEWQVNPSWVQQWEGDRQHPIHVRREVRNWGGFMREENYFITEYTLTNVSDSTLHDAYMMLSYAFAPNSRAWGRLFPGFTSGARNTRFLYQAAQRSVVGFMDNYPETTRNESWGYYAEGGPLGQGEFLAPGYVGFRVLDITPDKNGRAFPLQSVAWLPADNQQDQQGPFVQKTGFEQQYQVVMDARNAHNAFTSPAAEIMRTTRTWSMMSLGPWDLGPGESIKIVYAEIVGGADYAQVVSFRDKDGNVVDPVGSVIGSTGLSRFGQNGLRAQFAYDNDYRMPKPPAAPPVEIALYDEPGVIANVITWSDMYDDWRDPDYDGPAAEDLAGYRLYRSSYLPLGPWELVADIPRGSPEHHDVASGAYRFEDFTVAQGFSYYYSLTAYDTGHDSWPVNPNARFPESGNTNRVPSLESSIYANRTIEPFRSTIPATDDLAGVLVVPNPFVARSGFINPGDADVIQFVNIPSPATLRIYTMRGNLVKTIDHDDGSGITFWDQVTDYGQYVESGVYIYHVETPAGQSRTGRFAIIR